MTQFLSFLWLSNIPLWVSLVAQIVKNPPAMQETQVQLLAREDPSKKVMVIHSRILAQLFLWTEKPGKLQSMGSQSQTPLSD